MPKNPKTTTLEKNSDGIYVTNGKTDRELAQIFRAIKRDQRIKRKSAKRTLTPEIMRNPTSKALKMLGEKAKGEGFTKADLVAFDKARKGHIKKYDRKTAGITYAFVVKYSRDIRINRANNQVDDLTGLTTATYSHIKADTVNINVKASQASKHDNHQVQIRLEQFDELMAMPPDRDYLQAAKFACKGRMSLDCSCADYQYRYRYLATMGNYQIKPPSEFAFPKKTNPTLRGLACKHILLAVNKLQSLAWTRLVAKEMERQAGRVGFGSNRAKFLSQKD